jgi:hypothetical protein
LAQRCPPDERASAIAQADRSPHAAPGRRDGLPYTPPKYVPPPRMDRWQRNLIVWIICAIVVFLAVAGFGE